MVIGYDTLDDVNTLEARNIADVYELVIGKAMSARDLSGVVTAGPLNQSQSHGGYWGRYPLSFKDHPEVWYMRISPKGRVGKPLRRGEVRQISVLVRQTATSKESQVTNVKLWLLPVDVLRFLVADNRQCDRGKATSGPMGVSVHGINLFENRATETSAFYTTKRCNTQSVLQSIATISYRDGEATLIRREAAMYPHYVIAASLAGLQFPDVAAPRDCNQNYTEPEWDVACKANGVAFKLLYDSYERATNSSEYLRLVCTAEDVCEQMSFVGYLDQRADPFYAGSMPDDMHKPSGMPLMVTIAICIACNPDRWGLATACGDDAFATKEAALFIESIMPSILSLDRGSGSVHGEQVHSFDVVINYTLSEIKNYILKMQSGQLNGKMGGVDPQRVDNAMSDSLQYLLCTGTAVCVDLFGLYPNCGGESADLYTDFGLASQLVDPVMVSRTQSAYSHGLGNTVSRWPILRTSTKGKRQLALAGVLVDVDRWLTTGKYNGVVLHPTAQASVSVRPEELDPTAVPAPPTQSLAAATRSSKKKKRPEALLADRGKLRGCIQVNCATEAVRSMFKEGCKDDIQRVIASDKLCGDAVQSASAILSDIIQQGAVVGMGDLFEITTYLVGPTSSVTCAHCENKVNVVQSVAFAGKLGKCTSCKHPRCLDCVSADIADPRGSNALVNCLFCCIT
jgi:hypothetical protein|tara:strand:+ start:466 stop:2514 length:2049 start_codon:yes stop_codon:yes gene_type:complete